MAAMTEGSPQFAILRVLSGGMDVNDGLPIYSENGIPSDLKARLFETHKHVNRLVPVERRMSMRDLTGVPVECMLNWITASGWCLRTVTVIPQGSQEMYIFTSVAL